jgi:menaquinone-dependent protoporphyrinogen oxidase
MERMMANSVLVGYATRYGSTEEVAGAIAATLGECGLEVDLRPVSEVKTANGYDAIVVGAPLFMFRWHKDALQFLSKNRGMLESKPLALFALGPVHEPHDEGEWQDSWDQLNKELEKFPWLEPLDIEMFGGKYAPEKLGFPLKLFAGAEPASDIRDWEAIKAWARALAERITISQS